MRQDEFGTVVVSLRRWILGLGAVTLVCLLALQAPRPRLVGFCVGWLLCLFSFDQIRSNAQRLDAQSQDAAGATTLAARTFLRRWAVIVVVLVGATKLGADPVAGALALLLLQAAVMCRSIVALFAGPGGDSPGEGPHEDETLG